MIRDYGSCRVSIARKLSDKFGVELTRQDTPATHPRLLLQRILNRVQSMYHPTAEAKARLADDTREGDDDHIIASGRDEERKQTRLWPAAPCRMRGDPARNRNERARNSRIVLKDASRILLGMLQP